MSNEELVKKIKDFFEAETINKNDAVAQFSNDVINQAYQKIQANIQDVIQNEEDPVVLSEVLQSDGISGAA